MKTTFLSLRNYNGMGHLVRVEIRALVDTVPEPGNATLAVL
ncbi:MAG: hypothetical protein ACR2NL_05960 [Acidimicrobiia bacterium]